MAISRLVQTTLQNGFEKFNRIWDERSAVGSMEPISAITLSATQSSVEFNNIPGTYSHLQLRSFARSTRTSTGGFDQAFVRFNGDAGTNYASHYLEGNGATVIAGGSGSLQHFWGAVNMPWDGYTANVFGSGVLDVLDYSNTSKNKTVRTLAGFDANGSGFVDLWSGVWLNTVAITSITLVAQSHSFKQYSSFTLYGIK